MMRSRKPVVRTIAGLTVFLLPACSVTRPTVEEDVTIAEAYVGTERPAEVAAEEPPTAKEPAPGLPLQAATDTKKDAAESEPQPQAATTKPAPAPVASSGTQQVQDLQSEIRRLSQREAASREALEQLKNMMQARAARPQVTYLGNANTGAFTPPAPAVNASLAPTDDGLNARERTKMQQEIQKLEGQLTSERQQRQELETQLKQLRAETSVGPYAESVNDELIAARRKAQGLEAALTSAQRARDDLAEKYEELKSKRETKTQQDADTQAQIAAFEQRQKESVQSLERELAASQAREQELRQAVAASEKSAGDVSYALVSDLRAENAALKAKLKEVHDRNTALSGKLKAASRVADMIFKERAAPPQDDEY